MTPEAEPKLAPPGAGLPRIELFIARLIFGVQRRMGNRDCFNARFVRERAAIRTLVNSCDPTSAGTRVLIKRLPGLEDSSRNWSVWMTLDHLRIVNDRLAKAVEALAKGIIPPGHASTAAVKPSPSANASVVDPYEKSCDAVLAAVSAAPDLKTNVRFPHPWFGPLDAGGWHALAGGHMAIHRKQLERILKDVAAATH
jgi:hypothetical protein